MSRLIWKRFVQSAFIGVNQRLILVWRSCLLFVASCWWNTGRPDASRLAGRVVQNGTGDRRDRGDVVVAGFFIAGMGALYPAARTVRSREGRLLGRVGWIFLCLFCAGCWITIGVNGIVRPPLLRAAFGRF